MLAKAARANSAEATAVQEQLRRLTASPVLEHAESLCLLLTYLVEHTLEKPGEHVKEYQIAVDVFGRSESFDPRLDSTVRVQTSRLRQKLVEYYSTTGAHDPVVIDIPKGVYTAVFHVRGAEAAAAQPVSEVVVTPVEIKEPGKAGASRPRFSLVSLFGGAALGLLAGLLLWYQQPPAGSAARNDRHELRSFWTSVLTSAEPPLVIFSNAEFTGRPETGLRYHNPATDSRERINDLYTGVGEALAIAELSDVFKLLGRRAVVKRSGLLGWDDTRNRDLIFVGSPTENLSLRELPLSKEFVFRPMVEGEPRPGDLAIVNERPQAGEAKLFYASAGLPLVEDYAVVMLQPGLHPGQSILLLAGTTTLGTQAAADFLCREENLAALRKRLGLAPEAPYAPFSAALRVRITRGVPVESAIVALHPSAK